MKGFMTRPITTWKKSSDGGRDRSFLTREEQDAMEPFVKRKMDETKQRILVECSDTEAAMRLSEILFE